MNDYNKIPNSGDDLPQKEEVLTPNIQTYNDNAPSPVPNPQPWGNINPYQPQAYYNQNMPYIPNFQNFPNFRMPLNFIQYGYVPDPVAELELTNSVSINQSTQNILDANVHVQINIK